MDEKEINLADLLKHTLLKWRLLIVWMLIGFFFCNTYENWKNSRLQNVEEMPTNSLSQSEVDNVCKSIDNYINLQKKYMEMLDYVDNSIYMKLNFTEIPTITIQYYVDNHYVVEYPTIDAINNSGAIIKSYNNILKDEKIDNSIREALNMEIPTSYFGELILCNANYDDTDVMSITVYGTTKEMCEKIAECIKAVVNDNTPELKKVYGDFDLKLVSEQFCYSISNSVMAQQQNVLNNIKGLEAELANVGWNLSESEKEHYRDLVDEYNNGEYECDISAQDLEINHEKKASNKVEIVKRNSFVSIKYSIIGIILFAFLACCWIVFRYIMSKKIKTADEIKEIYNMDLLGKVLVKNKKNKKLFGFVDRSIENAFDHEPKFTYDERLDMICAGIVLFAKKRNINCVYITGSSNDEATTELCNDLIDKLKIENISVSTGKSIIYDPNSLENMASVEGIVYVERIGYSLYLDIQKEIELSEKYDINLIGGIVIE